MIVVPRQQVDEAEGTVSSLKRSFRDIVSPAVAVSIDGALAVVQRTLVLVKAGVMLPLAAYTDGMKRPGARVCVGLDHLR